MTSQVEALFSFVKQTIDTELVEELAFLESYDRAKKAIQDIVDMPDQKIDLLIRVCLQNDGRLPVRRRTRHFEFLSDDEVVSLEDVIQSAYGNESAL